MTLDKDLKGMHPEEKIKKLQELRKQKDLEEKEIEELLERSKQEAVLKKTHDQLDTLLQQQTTSNNTRKENIQTTQSLEEQIAQASVATKPPNTTNQTSQQYQTDNRLEIYNRIDQARQLMEGLQHYRAQNLQDNTQALAEAHNLTTSAAQHIREFIYQERSYLQRYNAPNASQAIDRLADELNKFLTEDQSRR